MWVLVRGGKVVLPAGSYDALMARVASLRIKDTDRILQIPTRWGRGHSHAELEVLERGLTRRRAGTHNARP